jgi:cysteine desulfurase
MLTVLKSLQANPSTPYRDGRLAAEVLEKSRSDLSAVLNVSPDTLIFTSGATEANNHIRSIATLLPKERRIIIYNPMEHPAMLEPLNLLANIGFTLIPATPSNQGLITVSDLEKIWHPSVSLLVMMAANNETGTLYDIQSMAQFAHQRQALLFSDMVQALGKIPLDLDKLGVDYASFSAHKIYGPKGVGALYVKPGSPFAPFMVGGSQEDGQRAGTESLHNIVGLATAGKMVPKLLTLSGKLEQLKETFIHEIKSILPNITINSPPTHYCQPGTISITFPGYDNAFLLGQLDFHGISVAAGSACRTGANEPSHVLLALGLTAEEARSTLRFSFGHNFSSSDLTYLIKVLKIVLTGDEKNEINVIKPNDISESFIFQPDLTIIHIKRYPKLPGPTPLPGSRVMALGDRKSWDNLDYPQNLFLTCEVGYDAPIIGWSIKKRGRKNISVLALGLWGLKFAQPELWNRLIKLREEEEKEKTKKNKK